MRILHTSDWHLGKTLEQVSRLEEQREFIDCLCQKVAEEQVDLVLIAGDIFDTSNPSAAAEELFYEAVNRLNAGGTRAIVVIAGNHDNPERLCAASPLSYKHGIILLGYPGSDAGTYSVQGPLIQVVAAGPGWLELCVASCNHHAIIVTLPYPSEARLDVVLSTQADEELLQQAYSERVGHLLASRSEKFRDDTVNLVVSHLFLCGGKESESERTLQVGGAMTVSPDLLPAKAHFVALGHLHRPQEIKAAPCPTVYSGSPLAYSFSEAGHSKAVYLVDAIPGKPSEIQPLYLDCGKPLCRWVAEEGMEQAIQWCEEGRDPKAWVDLEIVTDRAFTMEEQKRLRELHGGILNIRPRMRTATDSSVPVESREGKKIDELFSAFYKQEKSCEIAEELLAAFVEVLQEETDDSESMGAEGVRVDAADAS